MRVQLPAGSYDLTAHDLHLIDIATRKLEQVPAQGSAGAVFDALRSWMPTVGGLIASMGASIVTHAAPMPDVLLAGWLKTPREQTDLMLTPLLRARPGRFISDTEALRGADRERIDLLQLIHMEQFGETGGFLVETRPPEFGGQLLFMTIALEGGCMFTLRDHAMLAVLRSPIHAMFERTRLPIIAWQSILGQIIEEREYGFICVSRRGRLVELNQRAIELISAYHGTTCLEDGGKFLERFAAHAVATRQPAGARAIVHETRTRFLDVSVHALTKETHMLSEDLWLVMLRENALPPKKDIYAEAMLTERQKEIARLLAETGLSYKQIADRLGIEESTMRKHAENIYRRMDVHSRGELVERSR